MSNYQLIRVLEALVMLVLSFVCVSCIHSVEGAILSFVASLGYLWLAFEG